MATSNRATSNERIIECPFCNGQVKEETKKDLSILTRLRLSIPVKCPLNSNGCNWEGDMSQFWNHLSSCNYFPRPCPYNCDPNVFMPKEILKTHLQDKCPMKSIPCEYKWAGCNAVCNRSEMAVHMKDSALIHNELLAKVAKSYKSQVNMLQAEINQMKDTAAINQSLPLQEENDDDNASPVKKRKVTFSQSPDIIDVTAVQESTETQPVVAKKMKGKPSDMDSLISPILGYANNMDKMSKQCPAHVCRYIKSDWRTLMIRCQSCDTWYHSMCAHIVNSKARELTEYICPLCKK